MLVLSWLSHVWQSYSLLVPTALVVGVATFILSWGAQTIHELPTNPDRQFFLGHLFLVVKQLPRLHDFLMDSYAQFGRTFYLTGPGRVTEIMVYPSVENLKHILKDNFHKYVVAARRIMVLKELMGDGIFLRNGDSWLHARRASVPMFSNNHLKSYMTDIIVTHGKVLVAKLKELMLKATPESPAVLDLQDMFYRYALDCFAKVAFGEDFNSISKEEPEPFAKAFDRAQFLMVRRLFNPLFKLQKIFRFGPEPEISRCMKVINDYARTVIAKRRKEINDPNAVQRQDLITHFFQAAEAEGRAMTDVEMRDVLVSFLVAGRDTTAISLSWFFYELSQNPEQEQKVWEEVDRVLEESKGELSFDVAKKLNYVEAAVLETIRLHPPIPANDKQCVEDDVLPDGTVVKAGWLVAFSPYCYGRSKELWGPQAEQFLPERWLDAPAPSQFKFPSFNAGPRVCLGRALALLETKLCVAMLASNFRFRLHSSQVNVDYTFTVTLPIKDGLFMSIHPREPVASSASSSSASSTSSSSPQPTSPQTLSPSSDPEPFTLISPSPSNPASVVSPS